MNPPNHLVIVCGHGIWLGGPKNGWDESEWLIESYKSGETPTFIEHIRAGIKTLAEDQDAVLVFSGGPTRDETPVSEAASYANLAAANAYFSLLPPDSPDPVSSSRVLLEERALDSYYNILFSIMLFWRVHHVWPKHITLVSHAFKRARLVDAHCAAIAFPLDRVRFVGIDPPGIGSSGNPSKEGGGFALSGQVTGEKAEAMRGVSEAVDHWTEDPHGVGEVLAGKRRKRNPWKVDQRLFLSDDERSRSKVKTRLLDGGGEALAEGGTMPWAGNAVV
ncbi:hypothetical protein QBC33DRAFT_232328 [Phialemonium atrogriseum]|uniref:DUF218 domain-containing protein n=1 Tax=Phialemonium atrogriseum TaxID=1093897 RepID=A0AAJ0C6Y7_9PEZI|nr:uncharacterized protein QBC33DRAFT_232328 [Phialemonium atrogriseum]KAK1771121.1 hypothetical protein QBC33DRAFT_232328 [Phialemonium atrogriseum]